MENIAFVIEDDQDLSSIFTEALKAAGFQAETIRDGAVAQQRLKQITPEIVILDMHLPNIDGTEILAQLHGDERLKKAYVIIVTADALLGERAGDTLSQAAWQSRLATQQIREQMGRGRAVGEGFARKHVREF